MSKISTRGRKESGFLAGEYVDIPGYCRKTVTVTIQAGMDIGAALQKVAGKYVWIANADVATLSADVGVLVDGDKDIPTMAAGDQQLAVLVRGPAALVDIGLLYKDTVSAPNKVIVQTALEKLGMITRVGV